MAQFCTACGAQIPDGSTVCPSCRRPIAQPASGAAAATGGISPGVAALLSYILWIPAIVFLLIEPYNKDRFTRFHSFQALFLGIASIVINMLLSASIIGFALMPFVWVATLVLAILGAVKAMNGEKILLPLIGPLAEKQANAI